MSEYTVFQQATTGVLHLRKDCSVTRRTRYSHFAYRVTDHQPRLDAHGYRLPGPNGPEMSRAEVAATPHCHKCWDGARP